MKRLLPLLLLLLLTLACARDADYTRYVNVFAGTDSKNKFEVYGFEQGLKMSAGTRDLNSDDTDGGWSVTLQEQNAPSSGLFLFSTDETTTRALLTALETAVPEENQGGGDGN